MSVNVEIDLRPQLLEVRDQGPRPTCLSQATTAAHERVASTAYALSPEYLHYYATGGQERGATFPEAASALVMHGQPSEASCPYHASGPPTGWTPPTPTEVFRRETATHGNAPDDVEALLRSERTPVLGLELPYAFYKPVYPWVITSGTQVRGRHAVTAVGFGEIANKRVTLVRNSWGTSWADAGYAWLDDDFLVNHLLRVFVLGEEPQP